MDSPEPGDDPKLEVVTNGSPVPDESGDETAAPASLAEPTPPPAPAKAATRRRRTNAASKRPARPRKPVKGTAISRQPEVAAKGASGSGSISKAVRLFPASTFQDALALAEGIWQHSGGDRIRRLTLFDGIGKSPESGPSRQLVTNSARYGLTNGSYAAEYVELTPTGKLATNPDASGVEKTRARFQLAIEQVPTFKALYDNYKGKKLPSPAVIRDFLRETGTPDDQIPEAIETFTLNAKSLGLLRVLGGAERIISIEQLLEETPRRETRIDALSPVEGVAGSAQRTTQTAVPSDAAWDKICFYVTPIGTADSDERQHSDLFLGSLVEPAVAEFGLTVVRADQIGKPGMITAQVIEHIVKSRLVVADLSFHNPNVFYELALRHARRLPVVQLTRVSDHIPFDLDQFRTVQIDTSSIFTLVPRLETYRSEIASHIRRALSGTSDVENPLTAFYPAFWDKQT